MDNTFLGITLKEVWTIFHGTILGGSFLLLFPTLITGIFLLGNKSFCKRGNLTYIRLLFYISLIITAIAWLTDLVSTYLPYPWYRAEPPEGTTSLLEFPRSYLLSVPNLAIWHKVGMEWKEHLGWIVPILCTPAAYILSVYGKSLEENSKLRMAVLTLFLIAFIASLITAFLGIIITKLAPVR